jgi:hypothetical protein
MFSTRHRQRVTAWIAFFAILMASLMPTVSRAMAAAAVDAASRQVCSIAGHHSAMPAGHHAMSPAGVEHDPSSGHGALHLDHCPFCLTHAGSFGLPPMAAMAVPASTAAEAHPPFLFQSPRVLVAWTSAQPRAPPFGS